MALVVKDRVLETSNTNGTGTFTLAGAVNGFQAFSVIGVGNTTYYAITEETNNQWEVGLGTVGSGTLTRDTVLSSSNNGNKVDFADGLKQVFCDYPADKAANLDSNNKVSFGGNSYEDFASISTPTYSEGRVWYDSGNHTLAQYNDVTNNIVHLGEEVQLKVINNTGSSIPNGSPVYITSTSSGQTYPNIALAKADTLATSNVIGLTNGAIANGQAGYVTTIGLLNPANTGTFAVGDVLYLSPYSAGQIMNTLPPTGYPIRLGIVAYSNNPNGAIYITKTNVYSLAANIVGTVAVANGGTGQFSALVAGAVVYGSSTTAMGVTAAGTSGQVLTSAGAGTPTWTTPATGSVTSVGGTGTVSGISLSGTVTSSGNLTLGGTLDLSSPPAIGATTPAAGTFTTITGQTEVLKGTGNNLFVRSSDLTNASWAATNVTLTSGQSDPFGGTTAFLMNTGTGTGNHQISQILSTPNIFTYSIYAKAGTANYFGIYASAASQGVFFNLTTGAFSANIIGAPTSYSSTNVGSGWWRLSITASISTAGVQLLISEDGTNYSFTGTSKTVTIVAPQVEVGTTANTYIPTTTTAIYGTPTLSFSGVAGLGLQSDGSLYVSPAGTGALQAQKTDSTATGGNARGANAVDWQTSRGSASQVANGSYSAIGGGYGNTANATVSGVFAGNQCQATNSNSAVLGGTVNIASGVNSGVVTGNTNIASGYYGFVGTGFTNSTTSNSAVTTQSGTMNATTAVTLSGSNASIKVGQYITGTSIANDTYVAAISGTALTLSKNASGSSTSTLSFYTPHGVVVGGGNNQATGSYSFIGGGGDAGTAANRNVASGDWSFVGGGVKNTATGIGSVIAGGGWVNGITGNTSSGQSSFVGAGWGNNASGAGATSLGVNNVSNGTGSLSTGSGATTRGITGNFAMSAGGNNLNNNGTSQAALLVLATQTTDATATVLTTGGGASGTNQVILPNNSAYYFTGEIISGVTGGGNSKGWTISGVIKRGANAGATTLVGSTVTSLYADAGAATWTIGLTADTTNGGLAVTFTGQASTTIRTVCQIRSTEMTF